MIDLTTISISRDVHIRLLEKKLEFKKLGKNMELRELADQAILAGLNYI